MGVARIIGAVIFSIIIGMLMSFIYRKEEKVKREEQMNIVPPPEKRPMWQTSLHFFTLVLILVFANWGAPAEGDTTSTWYSIWHYKWWITGFFSMVLAYSLIRILKIKWQWVLGAFLVTVASVILSNNLIDSDKLRPLVPMLVGIIALSVITIFDKWMKKTKPGPLQHGISQNRSSPCLLSEWSLPVSCLDQLMTGRP
jgi:uncharacterized membrane protein YraQ (UPF0718 family)